MLKFKHLTLSELTQSDEGITVLQSIIIDLISDGRNIRTYNDEEITFPARSPKRVIEAIVMRQFVTPGDSCGFKEESPGTFALEVCSHRVVFTFNPLDTRDFTIVKVRFYSEVD